MNPCCRRAIENLMKDGKKGKRGKEPKRSKSKEHKSKERKNKEYKKDRKKKDKKRKKGGGGKYHRICCCYLKFNKCFKFTFYPQSRAAPLILARRCRRRHAAGQVNRQTRHRPQKAQGDLHR